MGKKVKIDDFGLMVFCVLATVGLGVLLTFMGCQPARAIINPDPSIKVETNDTDDNTTVTVYFQHHWHSNSNTM